MRAPGSWWVPAAALLGAGAVVIELDRGGQRALLTFLAAASTFAGLHLQERWSRPARAALLCFLLLIVGTFGGHLVEEVRSNLDEVGEWDFLGFWLHARTAVRGADFYDPANAVVSAAELSVSEAFHREIIQTGFWYPPPSMFLFLPLGWLDPPRALALWYAVQIVVLAIDVVLLWRIFLPAGRLNDLAACAVLIVSAYGSLSTFYFAQTSFIALLTLLLFWPRQGAAWGGLWAAVGIFVKPFLAVLVLCLAVGRRWRALAGLAAATAALVLGSAAAFGPRILVSYVEGGAASAKPEWVYSQPTNQSLVGLVLRTTKTPCAGADCALQPMFLGAAAILAALTIPLGLRLARTHASWTIALYLLLALLVYPVSQVFYSVLLIPLMLLLWQERARVVGGAATMAVLCGAVHALAAARNGRMTVAAFGVMWAATALMGLGLARGRGWPLRRSESPSRA